MVKEVVMYSRTQGCPYVTTAKRVLQEAHVPYREIHIDKDPEARNRVLYWTGFLSVPTLVIAENGSSLPISAPEPLPEDAISPRGIDRGTMITEPSADELMAWLRKHNLIP
jgi:glutaredoxin